jgi:hypothetical protein
LRTVRTVSRIVLARRLMQVALQIAAGKPVRVGGASIRVPERVLLEEELEAVSGTVELEFELKWAAAKPKRRAAAPRGRSSPRTKLRRAGR